MKKQNYLYVCAVLGLAACTSEDIVNDVTSSKVARGIAFEADYPSLTMETRGELVKNENKKYDFFWFAEKDRLNIYADGDIKKGYNSGSALVGTLASDFVEYKATKSAAQGFFTAISDEEMLLWDGEVKTPKANFIGTYPASTKVENAVEDLDGGLITPTIVTEQNADQTLEFNEVKAPMYGISNNVSRSADYESVGEKVGLQLTRMYPVIYLSSVEGNNNYSEYLGELTEVHLNVSALEAGKDDEGVEWEFVEQLADKGKTKIDYSKNNEITRSEPTNGIKVTMSGVKEAGWSAEDHIEVAVLPVEAKVQKKDRPEEKKNATLKLTIDYKFKNVTLTQVVTRSSSMATPHMVYTIPALNIAEQYKYLVTENKELIVFGGDHAFSSIYEEGDSTEIVWGSSTIPVEDILSVRSDVILTDAELATLANYSSAKKIDLPNQTRISAGTFYLNNGFSPITDLILPKVTAYEDEGKFNSLVNLNLASFAFETESVVNRFFEYTSTSLKTMDISAVDNMNSDWKYYRTLSFKGFKGLTDVTLGNVILSEEAFMGCEGLTTVEAGTLNMSYGVTPFKGCKVLKTVTATSIDATNTPEAFMDCEALETVTAKGGINLTNAKSAFEGCGSLVTIEGVVTLTGAESAFKMCKALETVNVATTVIPASAFRNAIKIKNVLHNGSQVKPTSVGEGAFFVSDGYRQGEGNNTECGALTYMNLSDAATIGADAFRNTNLTANEAPANGELNVLTVGATNLVNGIFQGTPLEYVEFTNAETIQDNPMYGVGKSLKQIKFHKAFTAVGGAESDWRETLGKYPGEVDLFVHKDQTYYAGKKLTLPANTADAAGGIEAKSAADFTFKSIKVNR